MYVAVSEVHTMSTLTCLTKCRTRICISLCNYQTARIILISGVPQRLVPMTQLDLISSTETKHVLCSACHLDQLFLLFYKALLLEDRDDDQILTNLSEVSILGSSLGQ